MSDGAYGYLRAITGVGGCLMVSLDAHCYLRVGTFNHQSAPTDTSRHLQTQVGLLRYQ